MALVYLIACVKEKLDVPARAEDLYIGEVFERNLAFARKMGADSIYILSGKHGLLELDDVIEPYDVNLHNLDADIREAWYQNVLQTLSQYVDFERDHFVIMADAVYRSGLTDTLSHCKVIDDFL